MRRALIAGTALAGLWVLPSGAVPGGIVPPSPGATPGAIAAAAGQMTPAQQASTLNSLGGYPIAGLMATNAANGGAVASVLVPQSQKNGERLSTANFGILPGSTSDVFGPARNAMPTGGVLYLPSAGAQGWQAPSYGTPEGMSFEADGPNIAADQLIGHGLGTYTWGKAWAARLPHNNSQSVTGYSLAASTYGSGYPTNDQTVLAVKAIKDNWNQSNVQSGGLGGIVVSAFNGSPTGVQSDTYALNTYVSVGYASGFAVTSENKINEACQSNGNECFETDFQQGIENSAPGGAHIGEQWSADLGVHTALFRTVGSVAGGDSSSAAFQQTGVTGRWGDLILNQLDGVANFQLTDTGAIVQASDGTTKTQITEANVAGADTWTNGAGTTILQLAQNGLLTTGNIAAAGYDVTASTFHAVGWSTGYDSTNGAMQLGTGASGSNPYFDFAYWNGSATVAGPNDVRWQNYKVGGVQWQTPGGTYYFDNGNGFFPGGVGVGGANNGTTGLAVKGGATTDTLTVTGSASINSLTANGITSNGGATVGGTLSAANGGTAGSWQGKGRLVTTITGATTLGSGNCDTFVRDNASSAHAITVPTGLPLGCRVGIAQIGTGAPTVVGASGVTIEAAPGAATSSGQFATLTVVVDSASTAIVAPGL